MPELPEVETVVRYVSPVLTGRRALRLDALDPKLDLRQPEWLPGSIAARVFRHGKQIVIGFASAGGEPFGWLCVHLRMTGRLVWRDDGDLSAAGRPPRAVLAVDGGQLLFQDARRLGTMKSLAADDGLPPAGLDPLGPEFTTDALGRLLAGSAQPVKPWLLRQDRLAGIGNIYASEILFQARIPPGRPAGALTAQETAALHRSVQDVLRRAIACCGTTFSSFQFGADGTGSFQDCLNVYGRNGLPCPACQAPVVRLRQQGRSTFFCPRCQRPAPDV